jgi:hypothetical protein
MNNNLVEIAKILKSLKQERNLVNVSSKILSKYPEGSEGIVINEENYIVINTNESHIKTKSESINTLKDSKLKYNPNFFLSTNDSEEPDIIDETHNKSKIITEAYTEVSFLPKDIYSEAAFNSYEAKNSLSNLIDKEKLHALDFDDYNVVEPSYKYGDVFDEIYRLRCIFNDITGNQSVESLLIKAFKVSNIKGEEYSYKVVNSEYVKEYLDHLETIVERDKSGQTRFSYSKLSQEEYENIELHIKEGIDAFYLENQNRFYRLTRVDVKAIYALRIKKIPIQINFLVDNGIIAKMDSYYSMVAGDMNVFTCPNCNKLSNDSKHADGMKVHIDQDFRNMDENLLGSQMPIGCTECMGECHRCGSWHFKFSDYSKLASKDFRPINRRTFLKSQIKKNMNPVDFCQCKEHLTWIYDEMSYKKKEGQEQYTKIIDKMLTKRAKLSIINYLTGEVIASYEDLLLFMDKRLKHYFKRDPKILELYGSSELEEYNKLVDKMEDFISEYLNVNINESHETFKDSKIENFISQTILDYKNELSKALNIPRELIKITSLNETSICKSCKMEFYKNENYESEFYYNNVKEVCHCCDEAINNNYVNWLRVEDGVMFYKPIKSTEAIGIIESDRGDERFQVYLARKKSEILNKKL